MQAIILAAGLGKRLRPLTDTVPKALVPVHGTPLLLGALNLLSNKGIDEVILVVGDKKDQIVSAIGHRFENMAITYVENPVFNQTNNVYSFYLARPYVRDDVMLLECDLFYDETLITTMLGAGKADCNILVSRFDRATMDGTAIHADPSGRVTALTVKSRQDENFSYEDAYKTVNVYTFSREFIEGKLFPATQTFIRTQGVNSYYELVLGSLVYYGLDEIKMVDISADHWCEIDDIHDLERAEAKFGR